jgi:hypothetical protein
LKSRKGEVAPERGLVPVEKCSEAFCSRDCARGIEGGAVVVAGIKVGVVVTALQLEAGFEDFGGNVDGRGGEVGNESCRILAHAPAKDAALGFCLKRSC